MFTLLIVHCMCFHYCTTILCFVCLFIYVSPRKQKREDAAKKEQDDLSSGLMDVVDVVDSTADPTGDSKVLA